MRIRLGLIVSPFDSSDDDESNNGASLAVMVTYVDHDLRFRFSIYYLINRTEYECKAILGLKVIKTIILFSHP